MSRLPEAFLAQIKAIPCVHVLEAGGHAPAPAGSGRLKCRCPFPHHEDKTPSFFVDEDKNLWKCFGACDAGGDVISLIRGIEGLGFVDAVAWLARFAGLDFEKSKYKGAARLPVGTVSESCPLVVGLDDSEASQKVAKFYHGHLLGRDNRGMKYLASRGLADDRLITRFCLGFAPTGKTGLMGSIPDCQRQAGRDIRGQVLRCGWSRECTTKRGGKEFTSARELFTNCITVPIFAADGSVVECYARKTSDRKDYGSVHLYLPNKHAGVWNAESCVSTSGDVILCEAAFDAFTFWLHGLEHVTWAYGSGGFTADHLEWFKKQNAKTVHIAYDNDEAGNKAAEKLTAELVQHGFAVQRITPPAGLDINAVAMKAGNNARDAVHELYRSSEWWGAAAPVVVEQQPTQQEDEKPKVETEKSAVPAVSSVSVQKYEREEKDIFVSCGTRRYRLRGLFANKSDMTMKASIRAEMGEAVYADTFDIYQAKARAHFVRACAGELNVHADVIRSDSVVLLRVGEQAIDDERERTEQAAAEAADMVSCMPEDEKRDALALLKDPCLLARIAGDLEQCGLIGEDVNKLTCYLGATSRLTDDPLGILIQSSSAAGKSSLMDAVLKFMPEEGVEQYSAMTEQSLFYKGEDVLKNKILAIAEEAGAGKIAYSLKILISDHYLSMAAPRQNPETGMFETMDYRVNGPTAVMMTTTADDDDLDDELLNRCLVMTVNEEEQQTNAIHGRQRSSWTVGGTATDAEGSRLRLLHHNAQRLLQVVPVIIPFAEQLTFAHHLPRFRRDHMKYLNVISVSALLHQYQRTRKTYDNGNGRVFEYIEANADDVAVANRIIAQVLGRSISPLPERTRCVLRAIDSYVKHRCDCEEVSREHIRFSRRELRSAVACGDTQLKTHLRRLVDLELMSVHKGEGERSWLYTLHYRCSEDMPEVVQLDLMNPVTFGLVSEHVSNLFGERSGQKGHRSGLELERSGSGRGEVGPQSGGGRIQKTTETPVNNGMNGKKREKTLQKSPCGGVSFSVENPKSLETETDNTNTDSEKRA